MPSVRIFLLTSLAMVAFAGNSLLCRLALKNAHIDAASFTTIRLVSGALMLLLLVLISKTKISGKGNWVSAFSLFTYAAGFSFAYISLPAAMGALLLFSAVQATMIAYGVWSGERFRIVQIIGLVLALLGLIFLLMPGLSAPPVMGCLLMLSAGIAWGIYSLRGKMAKNPNAETAGNFLRAIPFGVALSLLMFKSQSMDGTGIALAICSGAITSGIGYAIWYSVLPFLKASSAATVQLSVPVIAAFAGILLLDEPISLRLVLATLAILGGIALVILPKKASTWSSR